MARLESGIRPEEAGQFWLKGHEMGLGQAKDQRREQMAREEENHRYMLEIQHAALEHQKEQARSQAILNEQAQMGDAQAVQQLGLSMKAGADPDEAVVRDIMGTGAKISDPKARALYAQSALGIIGEMHQRKQRASADQALDRAAANGLIKPEDIDAGKQRMDSGEPPQNITQELHKAEQDKNVATMAAVKAAEAIAQAEALVKSAPPGHNKLAAQYALTHFKNSPHDQQQPGADAKMIEEVQRALLPSQKAMDAQAQQHKEHLQEMLGPNAQAPGMGGMTMGQMKGELEKEPHASQFWSSLGNALIPGINTEQRFVGGPNIPTNTELPGTHATLRGKGKRSPKPTDIAQVFGSAKSAEQFHDAVRQMGIDPDSQEGKQIIIKALGGGDGQSDD